MSRTVEFELEDDEYQVLAQLGEAYGIAAEGMARLSVLSVNQSYITSVANPRVVEELAASEFGEVMLGRLSRAIEREQEREAG